MSSTIEIVKLVPGEVIVKMTFKSNQAKMTFQFALDKTKIEKFLFGHKRITSSLGENGDIEVSLIPTPSHLIIECVDSKNNTFMFNFKMYKNSNDAVAIDSKLKEILLSYPR
jgi:hypothetical protein